MWRPAQSQSGSSHKANEGMCPWGECPSGKRLQHLWRWFGLELGPWAFRYHIREKHAMQAKMQINPDPFIEELHHFCPAIWGLAEIREWNPILCWGRSSKKTWQLWFDLNWTQAVGGTLPPLCPWTMCSVCFPHSQKLAQEDFPGGQRLRPHASTAEVQAWS